MSLIDKDGKLNLSFKSEEEVNTILGGLTDEQCLEVKQLWIVDCQLHKFPPNITKMVNLWGLYVSGHKNYIIVFPDLRALTKLEYLLLPEIGALPPGFKNTFNFKDTQKMLLHMSKEKYAEEWYAKYK